MPAVLKMIDVLALLTSPNDGTDGPESTLQWMESDGGVGRPSSVTLPSSVALSPTLTLRSAPASTAGRTFAGLTVMVTSALAESSPSVAVKRRTYAPGAV